MFNAVVPQPVDKLSQLKRLFQVVVGFCLASLVYLISSEFLGHDFNIYLKENPTEFSRLITFYYYVLASIYIFFIFPEWSKWSEKSQLKVGYPVAFTILIFPRVLSFFISQEFTMWTALLPCGSIFITFVKKALELKQTESLRPPIENSTKDFKKNIGELFGLHGSFLYYICIALTLEYVLICITSVPTNYICFSMWYVLSFGFLFSTSFLSGYFSKKISEAILSFLDKQKFKDAVLKNLMRAFILRNVFFFIVFAFETYILSSFIPLSFLLRALVFIPFFDFSLTTREYALIGIILALLGAQIGKLLSSYWWKTLTEENKKKWEDIIKIHTPSRPEITLNSIGVGLSRTIFLQHIPIIVITSLISLKVPFVARFFLYAIGSFFFVTILWNFVRFNSAMFGFDEKTMTIIVITGIFSPMFSISVEILFRYYRARFLRNSLT